MNSVKLILIRHGQTDWNLEKRYCGFTDIGLNEKGKAQARKLIKRLTTGKVHKVYSSDMKRALEFGRIVFKDMPIEEISGLREMNFGIFEGLTYREIMDRHSKIYQKWIDDPLSTVIPDAESLDGLASRVRKAVAKILSCNKNKTVALFTHAGPIRVILCEILKLGLRDIWRIEPGSASISLIDFVKGKGSIQLLKGVLYRDG